MITYNLKDMTEYPLFIIDAIQHPLTWVKIGVNAYVRYIPKKATVELVRK